MTNPIKQALEALESIALAGMSGTGQESEEGMRAWHARRAWEFIGIAARALEPLRAALEGLEKAEPFCHHDGESIVHSAFKGYSGVFPLYRHPAPVQAEPAAQVVGLTDAQVDNMIRAKHFDKSYQLKASDKVVLEWYRLGVRDAEAAHGIKPPEKGGAV